MRYLLATVTIHVAGFVGGIVGWTAGLAMDRYRWLGLGPEEFWHTDPENVWAWGFLIGAAVGISLAAVAWTLLSRKTGLPKMGR